MSSIYILAVAAALIVSFLAIRLIQPKALRSNDEFVDDPPYPNDNQQQNEEDVFWSVISHTLVFCDNQEKQLEALRHRLRKFSVAKLEQFSETFDRLLRESYSWDLWGAAYVMMGGASDDSFEYFRVWMIARGRPFFELAKRRPDSMAEMLPPHYSYLPDFELFAAVASQVWAEKTGKEQIEMPNSPNMFYPGIEPSGQPIGEESEELATRYPKLWARFSQNPL